MFCLLFALTLQAKSQDIYIIELSKMNIFKIKKEERILAISTVLICTALHVLLILSYPTNFFKAGKLGFWSIFYKHFTVSGFDAYSYIFLSNEKIYYELSRHPLFDS